VALTKNGEKNETSIGRHFLIRRFNLVPSEHSPSENVRIHIMVMLRNTRVL
jgi:hypothetical protein